MGGEKMACPKGCQCERCAKKRALRARYDIVTAWRHLALRDKVAFRIWITYCDTPLPEWVNKP